jgi:hypothetical protein
MSEKEEGKIEYKILEAKPVGSNIVCYRLEDGALVKIYVFIDQAGVSVDYKGPDGNPVYNITHTFRVQIVPPSKRFFAPMLSPKPKAEKGYVK